MRGHRKHSRVARPLRLVPCLLLFFLAYPATAQLRGQEDDITVLTVAPTFSLNEVTA